MSGDRPTVIVGCGIGGVTAALALQAIGRPVVVLERSSQPGDSGSGITLFSNGLAGLDWIGVGAVRAIGAPLPLDTSGLRRPDGRMLVGASAVPTTTEAYAFHRSDLHRVLRERLANGVLRTGCEVTGLRVKRDHVVVDIAGGEAVDASLVVAADGLRSPIRAALHPNYPGPRYAGYFSWRAVTPGPVTLDRVAGETWGSGERFGIVPLRDGRVYWFAVANVPRESLHAELVRDDPPAELLRRFGDWHSPIPALLAATPSEAVLPLPIYDLPTPLPRFDRGRVALLGDAAHAMTPDLGQGASQAIEDAVTLASLLTCGPPDEIDPPYKTALSRYTADRRTRTERLLKAARRTGRLAQLQSPLAVRARSALLQIVPPARSLRMVERATSWTPPDVGPFNESHREDSVN